MSNAIKFTPAGGEITIHLSATDSRIRVEVTDSGVGLSMVRIVFYCILLPEIKPISSYAGKSRKIIQGDHPVFGIGVAAGKGLRIGTFHCKADN